jgi:hypothetical protein
MMFLCNQMIVVQSNLNVVAPGTEWQTRWRRAKCGLQCWPLAVALHQHNPRFQEEGTKKGPGQKIRNAKDRVDLAWSRFKEGFCFLATAPIRGSRGFTRADRRFTLGPQQSERHTGMPRHVPHSPAKIDISKRNWAACPRKPGCSSSMALGCL